MPMCVFFFLCLGCCLKMWKGILLHGPLLGWAKMSGDSIFHYKQPTPHGGEPMAYMMPIRTGVEFLLYPWYSHLRDACDGAKRMLTLFGEWTYTETVAQAMSLPCSFHGTNVISM